MPGESSSVGSEEELFRQRSKIYVFRAPSWQEAGLGNARLLKNKETGEVRFRFEDEKKNIVVANHLVIDHPPYCQMTPTSGSDKIWEWIAQDHSGDERKLETFALKFGAADRARQFNEAFEEAKRLNSQWFLPELAEHSETAEGVDPEVAAADEAVAVAAHAKRDDGYQATGAKAPVDMSSTSGAAAMQATSTASPFHGTSLFSGGQGSATPGGFFASPSTTAQPPVAQESFQDCRDKEEVQDEAQQHSASSAPAKEQAVPSTGGPWSAPAAGGLFAATQSGGVSSSSPSSGGFFSSMASGGVFSGASSSGSLFSSASSGSSTGGASSGGLFSGGLFSSQAASSSASSGGLFSAAATPSAAPLNLANLFSSPASTPADSAASQSNPFAGIGLSLSSPASSGAAGGLFSASSGASGGLFSATSAALSTSGGLFASSTAAPSTSGGPFATSATPTKEEAADQDNEYVEEEEVEIVPGWTPSVTLDVMDHVETGEEEEKVIYVQRAKLLRFRDGDWKERGVGDVKLLKHRKTGRIRFMLRQEKTMKIVGNHYVLPQNPYCDLKPNAGSDKIWQWTALDYSDGDMAAEQLALKFRDAELAQRFKESWNSARAENAQAIESGSQESEQGTRELQAAAAEEGQPTRQTTPEELAAAEACKAAQEELLKIQTEATAEEAVTIPQPPSHAEELGLFSPAPLAGPSTAEASDEQEEAIYCQRAKLYRFRDGEWRDRGLGEAKLLQRVQGEQAGMVRFELRQESTGLVVANHWVIEDDGYCDLTPGKGSDKSWMWTAQDCSDGEPIAEKLALKFKSAELANEFKEAFDRVKEKNTAVSVKEKLGQQPKSDVKEVSSEVPEQPASETVPDITYGTLTICSFAGHNLHNADSGLFGDVSDPYVVGYIGDSGEKRTAVIKNNLNPVWKDEEFEFQIDISDPSEKTLYLKVMDKNNFHSDAFLGSLEVDIEGLARGEKTRIKQALKDIDKGELEFEICFQPGLVPEDSGEYAEEASPAHADPADASPPAEQASAPAQEAPVPAAPAPAAPALAAPAPAHSLFGGLTAPAQEAPAPAHSLFGSSFAGAHPMKPPPAEDQEDDYVPEEEVTVVPGWTASVTLEVKDKIETGEEDEEVLHVQRAKLLRFRDGEWKERGLGDAKLLKHKETGKVRFMLRQEKTMKIVGNHYVIDHDSLCKLTPNGDSDKIWCWLAQDYSDGEPAMEKFALKLKTPEQAQKFQEAFEEAKTLNKAVFAEDDLTSTTVEKAPDEVAEAPKPKEEEKQVPNLFASKVSAPSESPWAGPASGGLFASSGGLFSGAAPVSTSGGLFSSASAGGLFSGTSTPSSGGGLFSNSNTGAGLFSGAASSSSTPAAGGLFAAASSGTSSGGIFSGISAASAASPSSGGLFSGTSASSGGLFGGGLFSSAASSGASSGGFFSSLTSTASASTSSGGLFSSAPSSGSTSSGSLFSSGAASSGSSPNPFAGMMLQSSTTTSATTGGLFSSAAATATSSGGLFASPAPAASTDSTAAKEATEQEEDQYVVEEEVTHVPGWTPSVSLDVKEVIETGEEDEEVLYSQRAKLLRFRDGDWKERGLGDAKLLKHRETGKVRFMLRQEKTMKIVSNHYVIDHKPYCDLKLNSGSDKCWMWQAQDYADGEQAVENFALKFRSPELAEAFKESFNEAKEINAKVLDVGNSSSSKAAQSEAKASPKAAALASAVAKKAPAPAPAEGGLFSSAASSGSLFSSAASGGSLFSSASSGSSLSTGGLFSGPSAISSASSGGIFSFTAAPAAASATAGNDAPDQPQGDDDRFVVEEEVTVVPGWTPSVTLEVRNDVATGEEDEIQVYAQRSKLRRFKDKEWKERGIGEAKLLKNPKTGVVRFLLRQEKTMKIVANHRVIEHALYCNLAPNSGSDKIWVWTAMDCADGETPVAEQFALAFANAELAAKFKEVFNQAKTPYGGDEGPQSAAPAKASPSPAVVGAVSKSSHGASPPAPAPAPPPKPSSSQGESSFYDWDSFQKSKFGQVIEGAVHGVEAAAEGVAHAVGGLFHHEKKEAEEENEEDEEDGDDDGEANGDYEDYQDVSVSPSSAPAVKPCGSLAEMAAQQAASGWRCQVCRMIWSDNVYECAVCEIPRPGYEEKAAGEEEKKKAGLEAAKSAFLGGSAAGGGFGGGGDSKAKASGFSLPTTGFGAPAASGSVSFGFGSGAAAPSSGSLFGNSTGGTVLFGSNPASSSGTGLFGSMQGSSAASSGSTGLFGSVQAAEPKPHVPVVVPPPVKAPIFGGPSASASLFGAPPASSGAGLFAATPATPPPPPPPPPPAETQAAGLFGAPLAATTAKASLFGAPASSKPPLFAVSSASSGASAPSSGPSLFGSSSASSGPSLFGSSSASSGTSLFGGAPASSGTLMFGGSAASSGPSLFGSSPASAGSALFKSTAASSGAPLFGGSAPSSGSVFSGAPAAPAVQDTEASDFLTWHLSRQQQMAQAAQAEEFPAKAEEVLPKATAVPAVAGEMTAKGEKMAALEAELARMRTENEALKQLANLRAENEALKAPSAYRAPGMTMPAASGVAGSERELHAAQLETSNQLIQSMREELARTKALLEAKTDHASFLSQEKTSLQMAFDSHKEPKESDVSKQVRELRDACMKAEERARKAEEAQAAGFHQSLEKQIETLRRTQKEEGALLSEALRLEQASREDIIKRQQSLEASLDKHKETADTALKVAEEARRVAQASAGNAESLRNMTVPERIMYYQKLHKQRALDGPAYLVGKENSSPLTPTTGAGSRPLGQAQPGSFLRRLG